MQEIWKDITGYENLYQVSNLGNIRTLCYGARNIRKSNIVRLLKIGKNNVGYCKIELYKDGKTKMKYIHRLVAEAFIPNPDKKPAVNHIDGNKANNSVSNLEWVTPSENTKHAFRTRLLKPPMANRHGKNNPLSKPIDQYTKDGIFVKHWDSIADAGAYFNVRYSNITLCLTGRNKTSCGYVWKYSES